MSNKKRILTGDRPTGKLHLGHYVGSLKSRVELQDNHEMFVMIADLHMLTDRMDSPAEVAKVSDYIRELVLDYLSVGIDPEKTTIFLQSQNPGISELFAILMNLVTVSRAQRIPTLKEKIRDQHITSPSMGLLNYPILQTADVLSVRAHAVPVGRDQESHIELMREIAREFNRLYGEVFPEPQSIIPQTGTLPGTDGKAKMSKSLGNVINLSDPPEVVRKQVMGMFTDPNRVHGNEPGNIKDNPVFIYLDAFSQSEKSKSKVKELEERYQKGSVKDVEVKEFLVEVLEEFLGPIRKRREEYEKQPQLIAKILKEGTQKARIEAQKTLSLVRQAMKLDYLH